MIWFMVLVLGGLVACALLWDTRRARDDIVSPHEHDIAVYRDQLGEIEREQASGALGAAEADSARSEIARRLLAAGRRRDAEAPHGALSPRIAAIAAIAIPMVAIALYALMGRPDLVGAQQAPAVAQDQAATIAALPPEQRAAAIRGMVESLAQRLRDQPDDLAGWRRLARARSVLGELPAAREAAARAVALAPHDADVLAEYAQTLLPERPEDIFSDELVATLRRIHAIDSSHATARFFLGVVESRAGNAAAARAMWEPLLARLPQDSELAAELRKRIESLPTR